ncbi:hypothetical protein [Aestuariivirga sp.]|uniref:hypothetical protein n=1 Tax=Aestuariivirga sp. TaxID=2650926 RepID=UPI0039E58C31
MRLCVVTPSEEFAASAGVRIRYDRLQAAAPGMGHAIDIIPITEFLSPGDFRHDAYVFAKTYSPVAVLLAWRMRQAGKPVGIDVFDDYFTQHEDARLLRYRQWFSAMQAPVDFYLCSTPRLAEAMAPLTGGKPVHIIADPAPAVGIEDMALALRRKQESFAASRQLRILWFGIGDNPYFPVGIHDLAAHGALLAGLAAPGVEVTLRILTNLRALNAQGLARLRHLPIPYTIEEWTEQREAEELAQAHAAFLPVSAQPFSRVKSLNRAITALASGTQVLAAGFPLYDPLAEFIYEDAGLLMKDYAGGLSRLRPETLPAFSAALQRLANPVSGVETMFAALSACKSPAEHAPAHGKAFSSHLLVVHGAQPDGRAHKLAARFNCLTVLGPDCRENLNCNIRFTATDAGVRVFVEENTAGLLAARWHQHLKPHGMIGGANFRELMPGQGVPVMDQAVSRLLAMPGIARLAAAAPAIRQQTAAILKALFPGAHLVVNDRLALGEPSSWSSA